jgi:hypothetical protein
MIAVAVLAITFAAGVTAGIAALLRLGIAREERHRSLRAQPGTRSAAATRQVLGLYVRMPGSTTWAGQAASPAQPAQPPRALPQRRQLPRELTAGRCTHTWDGLR